MALQARDECLYRHRAELRPDAGTEFGYGSFGIDSGAIGPVCGHSIEGVGDRQEA